VTVASICARAATLVSSVVLARILEPSDFGLLAVAMAVITFSQGATQSGFESALIQKQNRPEDFLNAAWTVELLRCFTLFAIIFMLAPLLASFFDEPRVVPVLRVASLTLVLQGVRNIGVVYFRKHFDFHKQFALEIAPLALYVPIVVALALLLRNVWALVWANLAAGLVACVLTYAMHQYRPRLDFNLNKAANLFGFGKWILGNSILVMVRDQGTLVFVGRLLGVPTVGLLNRADAFSTAICQQLNDVAWKVAYPAYSHLHVYPREFKSAYLKTLHILTLVGLPMAGGIFVLSRDFVHLFLTDKWLSIAPLIEVLCLQAVASFVSTPALAAFQAAGKPDFVTKVSLIGILLLAAAIYPLTSNFGATGSVWALCISAWIPAPILWFASMKLVECSFMEWFKPIGSSIISTCAMIISIVLVKTYVLVQIELLGFFVLVGLGMSVYAAVTLLVDKTAKQEIAGYVKATI